MRRFASEASPELWRRCVDCAPWPLGACLRWSSDSAALRTLADAADRGELGDRADWDAAEKRWVNHGVRLDELLPRESARPFTRSIREEGFLPDVADFAASWHWEDPVTSEAQAGAMGVHAYVQAMLTWRAASSEHRIPSWFADSIEPWDLMMYPGKPILTAPELRVVLRDVPVNFSQVRVFLGKPCADDTGLLAELIEEFPHHLTLDEAFWRDEQASAMLDPERWNALGLPRPSPPAPMGLSPDGVERILGVEVTNLRLFDALTLELSAERSSLATRGDPEAPWLVLLGENSVGKTTLLRSLALALVDPADATAMLTEARAAWRREDTQDATVTVRLPGQSYSVTITSGETERESLKSRSEPANGAARERPFVVGYGCRRGAADGGRDQKVVVERLDDIGTLFDAPGRALVLAEAWLKDLELASLKNETGTAHLFEVVREVLVGDASTGRAGILPG